MIGRVAILSEHASPTADLGGVDAGGQNLYVAQVAVHLAALGYEVDVFTRRDNPRDPSVERWRPGVRVIRVTAGPLLPIPKEELLPYMDEFTRSVGHYFRGRRKPYDLMHANFWMSGITASALRQQWGVPFVITFHALGKVRRQHQGKADRFPDERFAIEDRLVKEADGIVAECPRDEEDLICLYGADPGKVSVVPCGFDITEMWPMGKPMARKKLGLSANAPLLLQLGRLVPRKGVDNGIRSLARLSVDFGIVAHLLVVGGDGPTPDPESSPELRRLREVAQAEGVSNRVTFVGRRGRQWLRYYYSAADIFVTTPWYEPFGITPLESMACGTVVVGSRVGGIPFTVREGETGYLVPPDDPGALAERLSHLYRNPVLRNVFAQRGVQRVREHFTWDRVVRRLAEFYEKVRRGQSARMAGDDTSWKGDAPWVDCMERTSI